MLHTPAPTGADTSIGIDVQMPPRLLRLPDVETAIGLRRSSIYAMAQRGEFPKPIKLTGRCSAWNAAEVYAWINSRIAAAMKEAA